jgi:hypothetical protein
VLVEGGRGAALAAAVKAEAGVEVDLAHGLAVEQAREPCRWAHVNAALMLHDGGANELEVREYLERWGLVTPERTGHMIRFLNDPTWRTYVITYPAGRDLCRAYTAGEPDGFRRLLAEQVRISDLLDGSPRNDRAIVPEDGAEEA